MHKMIHLVGALAAAALVALTGCGDSKKTAESSVAAPATTTAGAAAKSLKGVCPDKIVIQTDWFGTPERAAAYQLVGPDGKIDASKGTYSGPLGNTGVDVEVRLGGAFIGFTPIPQQMYTEDEIFMGLVATDDAVGGYKKFPTKAVVTPLDINPQVVMWDPATYDVKGWRDIAGTGAKISYVEGLPFMDYLVEQGLVKKEQLDASFDGTPARFVAAGGKLMQQAYESNEPFRWETDVRGWKKPVKTLLVHDAGYQIYPQGYAVKSGDLEKNAACLKELVPMIQSAQRDYTKDPKPINDTLVRIYDEINQGPPISAAANEAAVKTMLERKLVSNGDNATLGDFDMERVAKTLDLLRPVFKTRRQQVPGDLKADDLATNEFIDDKIGL